jgi:hypothetical protein
MLGFGNQVVNVVAAAHMITVILILHRRTWDCIFMAIVFWPSGAGFKLAAALVLAKM